MSWWSENVTDPFSDAVDSIVDTVKDVWDYVADVGSSALEHIFSWIGIDGETVYAVDVSTQLLSQGSDSSFIQRIILEHAISDISISQALLINNTSGSRVSIAKYLAYGQDHYAYGIPTTEFSYEAREESTLQSVISVNYEASAAITILTIDYLPILFSSHIKFWLQENTAYVYASNGIPSGYELYTYRDYTIDGLLNYVPRLTYSRTLRFSTKLETTIATVTGTETTTVKEFTETYNVEADVTEDTTYALGSTVTQQPGDGSNDGVTVVTLTFYDVPTDSDWGTPYVIPPVASPDRYITCFYELDSAPGIDKIFTYAMTSGVHLELEALIPNTIDDSEVFPIVPLRRGTVTVKADNIGTSIFVTQHIYDTSQTLLNFIGLRLEDLTQAIESNGDIGLIQDAFILFGVNVYTQSIPGIKVLYRLFSEIYPLQIVDKVRYDYHTSLNNDTAPPINTWGISEQSYNLVFDFNYISFNSVIGSIGPVGAYTNNVTILANTPVVPEQTNDEGTVIEREHGNDPRSYITLRNQINATTYEEYQIHGVRMSTVIVTTGTEAMAKIIELEAEAPDDKRKSAIIPLANYQLTGLSPIEVEQVLTESLIMSVYAKDSQYLEYYETKSFSSLFTAIALFLTIISLGKASSLIALAKALFVQLALKYTLEEILSHNISPAAKGLVIAAYAYASAKNLSNAAGGAFDLLSAETLLALTNAVTEAANIDTAIRADALQEDIDAFQSLVAKKEEELEAALSKYDDIASPLDPYDARKLFVQNTYESPTSFYERTIHNTNPGVASLDQIQDYYKIQLRLPELD